MGSMNVLGLDAALTWLRSSQATPIPADWVPGAVDHERVALGLLGAVARHALGDRLPRPWPAAVQSWLDAADKVLIPGDVVEEIDKCLVLTPDAALANLYANLVASERRRVLGTFFTPSVEVGPMLEMWDAYEAAPSHVVDVGAGVGVFTAGAAQRWGSSRVSAIDVNPITLGLLGARMAQGDVAECASRVDLVLADFTAWLPTLGRTRSERRLILGNPPYTRSQLIPPELRSRLAEETADLCGARASLSAYISALALLHLGSNDGMCLLLPAQWLESEYARKLRRHLLELSNRRVELRLVNSTWFEDVTVDAVVLLVGTERPEPQPFVIANWGDRHGRSVDREQATVGGWRRWFEGDFERPAVHAGLRYLRDVARLRRGTATGANEFFLLSDDLVASHGVPTSALMPAVRRLATFDKTVTQHRFNTQPSNERRWLLKVTPDDAENEGVAMYLEYGKRARFHERHLCATRAGEWYDLEHDLFVPDVIITSMTRDKIRIVENEVHAAITNNLYGWVWNDDVPRKTRTAILGWLRGDDGQAAIFAKCRRQGDGLAKVEPKALAGLALPASLFA